MRAIQRTRSRTSNQPACNFALFTLLLEDDFQSETVNFARLQLPSTYNFPNKWGAGMIGADVARSTPVRNCFGTGRTFTWNHSRKPDGWVSIRGRRPRFERRPKAVSEDYALRQVYAAAYMKRFLHAPVKKKIACKKMAPAVHVKKMAYGQSVTFRAHSTRFP